MVSIFQTKSALIIASSSGALVDRSRLKRVLTLSKKANLKTETSQVMVGLLMRVPLRKDK